MGKNARNRRTRRAAEQVPPEVESALVRPIAQMAKQPRIRRVYEVNPKHGGAARSTSRGVSSAAPTNGQAALDRSAQVKPTSPRRVGVDHDSGEVVVFDRHHVDHPETPDGETVEYYHGHVRDYGDNQEFTDQWRNVLKDNGLVDRKGRPTPPPKDET